MKHTILRCAVGLLIAAALLPTALAAEPFPEVPEVQVCYPTSVTRSEDNRLTISMDIIMQANMKITSNRFATLTPILEADERTKSLPPVVIYGRRRALTHERNNTIPKDAFVILRRKRHTDQKVNYLIQLPYEA